MLKKIDKKICLAVGAAVLLSGGLIWLAVFWQLGKIRQVSDDIQSEQLDSLVRDERSRKILETAKELGDVEKSQEKIGAMYANKEDLVPFIRTVENAAALTGNSIKISVVDLAKIKSLAGKDANTSSQADEEDEAKASSQKGSQDQKKAAPQNAKPDFSNQLGFSVELAGKYGALIDFLTKLENAPYLIRVYNFQVSPVAKTSQPGGGSVGGAPALPIGEGEKNVNTILTISVYTDGGK